ncbi:MAG TPA: hypothetical protein PKX10_12080 [Propioniciclava tarda]|nr:hypothetical protein [Propioniciclava tarda]HQA32132.1 hypothetical protein [Propioniciclava tarda]HQD61931.1 hypothetical protein [Propioniciclava tarda]
MMPIVIRASARRALNLVVMGVILVVCAVFLALAGRGALERGVGWFG